MERSKLIERWLEEEQEPFSGWDFSHLDERMSQEEHPWSYLTRAGELMQGAASAVDLDTGGGERFLSLRDHWPPRAVATEGWPPNTRLAASRLVPAGALLVMADVSDDNPLPFADRAFDVVLNRHAAFNSAEVARCLTPGGTFLTQQVHGRWAWDLLEVFGVRPDTPDATPARYVPRLEAAGLTITDRQEWEGKLEFTDVGAIVYYLKAIPWEVPGFSVRSHLHQLNALQDRLEAGRPLSFWAGLYLIEARK